MEGIFALVGVIVGGVLTALTEWSKRLTAWNQEAAHVIAELELFWPLADTAAIRADYATKPIEQVHLEVREGWQPVWRAMEVIHAGHPRRKVREAAGAAILRVRSVILETELLGAPDSKSWENEREKEVRSQHLKASTAIDQFQASLHRVMPSTRIDAGRLQPAVSVSKWWERRPWKRKKTE